MTEKTAKADLTPVRQRTQFSCVPCSLAMALNALGLNTSEDEVNDVLGARPMKGASWEQVLAAAQHFGCRATLTMPATVTQIKEWTDAGTPVLIAWNPEGREWSHASVVFDVSDGPEGRMVHVADPNLPNPEKTTRVMGEDEFYGKWYEKWPNYLVRRPAVAIEREITPEGRQVMASQEKVAVHHRTAEPYDCYRDGLRGRALAECYMLFPNDLGPDDIEFIQRYFPSFNGGSRYPSRPRVQKSPVSKDFRERANKLLVALWFSQDKGKKFVKDNLYKSELSVKQLSWFESLERKYARVIRDLPDDLDISFHVYSGMGSSLVLRRLSPGDKAKVEKHFDLEAEGHEWVLRPKSKAAPAPAAPSPSAAPASDRNVFDRDRTQKMVVILKSLGPSGMLQGFIRDLESGKGLMDKQLSAVRHQLYKSRRKPEADVFRMASDRTAAIEISYGGKTFDGKTKNFSVRFNPHDRELVGLVRAVGERAGYYRWEPRGMWWSASEESARAIADEFAGQVVFKGHAERELKMASGQSIRDSRGHTWDPRRGLEGPFRFRSGIVLYYDPRESGGQYYDPSTDMYVDNSDFSELTGENWKRRASGILVADMFLAGRKRKPKPSQPVTKTEEEKRKEKGRITGKPPKQRNMVVKEMVEHGWGSGAHGGGPKTKNRRDRRDTKNELRQHMGEEN